MTVELAFLSCPSALVLKDNWIDLYIAYWKDPDILNCPDMQALIKRADIQMNVIEVVYNSGNIFERNDNNIHIPDICFKKNMISEPLLKGE